MAVMPRLLAVALGCLLAVAIGTLHERASSGATYSSMSPALGAVSHAETAFLARPEPQRADRSQQRHAIRRTHRAHRTSATTSPTTVVSSVPVSSTGIPAVWQRVAHCESTDNWHINTGNGFYGGLQITASNAANYGFARPDLLAPRQQVRLGRLILRDQGVGAWPICGPEAGLQPGD